MAVYIGTNNNQIRYQDTLTNYPLTFSTDNLLTTGGNVYAPLITGNHFFFRGARPGLPSPWIGPWRGGGNPGGGGVAADSSIISTSFNDGNPDRGFELRFQTGTVPELSIDWRFISRLDFRRTRPNTGDPYLTPPEATIGYQARDGYTVNRLFTFRANLGYNLRIDQGTNIIFTYSPDNTSGGFFWMNEQSASQTSGYTLFRSSNVFGGVPDCTVNQGTTGSPSTQYSPAIQFNNNVQFAMGIFEHNNADYRLRVVSDHRLKTDIQDLDDAWSVLDRIKPRRFHWKTDTTGAKTHGFIAHEVQEVLPRDIAGSPQDIDEDGNPRYQMMDAAVLLPYLVAGVRDLARSLDALRSRAAALGT